MTDFANQFLERLAAAYGLSYDMVAAHYDGQLSINYDKITRARRLINDAIHNKHWGRRGWQRKIKRAARLQGEATGGYSSYWLSETIARAEDGQLRYRSAITNAVLAACIDTGAPA